MLRLLVALIFLDACVLGGASRVAGPATGSPTGGPAPVLTSAGGDGSTTSGSSAGASATGGSSAGTSAPLPPVDPPPPHQVSACPTDAGSDSPGVWVDVTPPGLSLDYNFHTPADPNFGASAFEVDPQDSSIVYLGTSAQGIYKSTDCGADWIRVDKTGDAGKGRNGTFAIDPQDHDILYTDGRYGPQGAYRSTNGGVDWAPFLAAPITATFESQGMVEWIAIDPTDHTHIVVTPHFTCTGTHAPNCMVETTDSGDTWRIIDDTPPSQELGGIVMVNRTTWFSATSLGTGSGIWRTTDGGNSWGEKPVHSGSAFPYLYIAADGSYFMPGNNEGMLHSTDGGANWAKIGNSTVAGGLAVTKTALFSTLGLNGSYFSAAPIATPGTWAAIAKTPTPNHGGWMIGGDPDHELIYSSNFDGGFWRYANH